MTTLDIQPGLRFLIIRSILVVERADDDPATHAADISLSVPSDQLSDEPSEVVRPTLIELAVTVVGRAKWVVDHWSCLTDDGRKLIVHPDDFLRPLPPAE